MGTTTSRLELYKPDESGELLDIAQINANFDKLDAIASTHICTSTTRPAVGVRFDGMLIRETDTKRIFTWNSADDAWKYVSGGNGEDLTSQLGTTSPGGIYVVPTAASRRKPRLWRTSDGRIHFVGGYQFASAAQTAVWTQNNQYAVISGLIPAALRPLHDIEGVCFANINTVGSDIARFILRGANATGDWLGSPGDLYWQPIALSRNNPASSGSSVWFTYQEVSWYPGE